MVKFSILVDGVATGLTIMAETAANAASDAYNSFWWSHLEKFKKSRGLGTITAKGPVRFPDGWQDVASF